MASVCQPLSLGKARQMHSLSACSSPGTLPLFHHLGLASWSHLTPKNQRYRELRNLSSGKERMSELVLEPASMSLQRWGTNLITPTALFSDWNLLIFWTPRSCPWECPPLWSMTFLSLSTDQGSVAIPVSSSFFQEL